MKNYDVQAIEVAVPRETVFAMIADPELLPRWATAFVSTNNGRALMRTPRGEVEVALEVKASAEQGTVDWIMTFPDGSVAYAYSRVVQVGKGHSIYSFILPPPPVPLEQLEGALEEQSRTLSEELGKLKQILENG